MIDEQNKKFITLNPDHDHTIPRTHRNYEQDSDLPAWHDPDSLDSWLKSKISRTLKQALPTLTSWHALHAWFDNHNITLTDTGGGGMRLLVLVMHSNRMKLLSELK